MSSNVASSGFDDFPSKLNMATSGISQPATEMMTTPEDFYVDVGQNPVPPVKLKVDGHPEKTTWLVGFDL